MANEYEGYIKVSDAARKLGVSNQRIRQLLEKNKLKCKETPYGRVIEIKSIEDYDRDRREYLWAEPQRELAEKRASGADDGEEGSAGANGGGVEPDGDSENRDAA